MAVWGVAMVKDEADVIEGTVRHMAAEVDRLLVADNGSTDGTRDILDQLARTLPLTVVDDPEPAYYQSAKMTALADKAYAEGARWVVPFDADELWWAEHRVSDICRSAHPRSTVVYAALHDHIASADDVATPDPFRAMVWRRRDPQGLPKVAIRWIPGATIRQGNHGVEHPGGERGDWRLSICHFPYRSAEQMRRKAVAGAAAYAATDLPEGMGEHWRSYGRLVDRHGPGVMDDIWARYRFELSPSDAGLVHEVAPYRRWEG